MAAAWLAVDFLLLLVAGDPLQDFLRQPAQLIRRELTEMRLPASGASPPLQVFATLNDLQDGPGIRVTIEIFNLSPDVVRLRNPKDTFHGVLQTSDNSILAEPKSPMHVRGATVDPFLALPPGAGGRVDVNLEEFSTFDPALRRLVRIRLANGRYDLKLALVQLTEDLHRIRAFESPDIQIEYRSR